MPDISDLMRDGYEFYKLSHEEQQRIRNPYRDKPTPMNDDYKKLQADIEAGKRAEERLNNLRSNCKHKWGEAVEKYNQTGGYMIKGDGPDWHGADKRSDFYVPSETKKYWSRTCSICGKEETTTQTEVVKVKPVFR